MRVEHPYIALPTQARGSCEHRLDDDLIDEVVQQCGFKTKQKAARAR